MGLDQKALEAAAKSAMEAHHGHGMWEKAGEHVTGYWRMIIGAGIRAYLAALAPAPAPAFVNKDGPCDKWAPGAYEVKP